MKTIPPRGRGLLALLAGAGCIGFAPIWVRWSEVGPVSTAFHRLMLALPFLALWMNWEGRLRSASAPVAVDRWWTVAAGIAFALDLSAWHLSIRYTTVADATLLTNLAPLFVTVGAWVFFGERVGWRFFVGMVVALVGAWRLTGASLDADPARWRGAVYGVATGFFYGCYQLCVARLRRHLPPGRVLFFSSLSSAPTLALLAVGCGENLRPASASGWLTLVGLAVSAQVLGQGLITYGFAHLPAGYSSLTLLFQPLVAALAGWMLLSEPFTAGQAAGGAILLFGLLVARFDSRTGSTRADDGAYPNPRITNHGGSEDTEG